MKLLAAAGPLHLEDPVPPATSGEWKRVRQALTAAARCEAFGPLFRSPNKLWTALHDGPMPRGTTWRRLMGNATMDDLHALAQSRQQARACSLASWNVRWLRSPHTPQAEAKRAIIVKQLIAGRPVAIQETHWTPDCEAVWAALIPGAKLYSSPARKGPRGGPQGGVAVFVPDSWQET